MKEHKSLNRHKYKFTDKSQSVRGIVSTVFAVLAIIVFCVAVFQSYMARGDGGREIGLLGLCTLFLSGVGLYFGVNSFKEEEIFFLFSWIGTIMSAVMLVGMGLVFLIGL